MRLCCGCWRSGTNSWEAPARPQHAGCMPCWRNSFPVEFPRKSPRIAAQELLATVTAADAVTATRHLLAVEHLEDLRRLDHQLRDLHRRMDEAVEASGTTVTELFGFGPVGAAIAIGYTRDIGRFASRDRFAAYNGTAPIEVSSGGRTVHRLSRRGNRQLNHAIHIAAITQIRHAHSPGRAYYERKLTEGKTKKEATRALKRRISRRALRAAHCRRRGKHGPGRATGDD